jgi:5-dehydro-4-deoxyglucarate dehydratase
MDPKTLHDRLHGVIGFAVTPFKADGSLDPEGLRRNLDAMLRHPVGAVVVAGGTGELYSLTPEEHGAIARVAVEAAGGRVPVVAGAGFGPQLAAQLAREAARAGVDGILAFPPYYVCADADGLPEYYRAIGEATPLGMIFYSRDWVNPGPAEAERLAKIKTLVAWKEGQGDLRRFQAIMSHLGNRLRWIGGVGDNGVAGYYGIGVRAFTSSVANVAPKLAIRLHEAGAAGRTAELRELTDQYVTPLYTLRARRRGYEVAVIKEMMNLLGMAAGPVRPPLPRLRPGEIDELRALVQAWKPVL